MIKALKTLSVIIIFAVFPAIVLANSAPVVSNVSASQRSDDSKLVDIYYDLADADGDNCTVWAVISDNNGVTWTAPAITLTGAVGSNISPGTGKHIIWDAGKDMPGKVGDYKARVFADDGHGPSEMVLVAAGNFLYQNTTPTFVPSFFIDKYEVTNARYCEFLNNADPTGQHYSTSMEIAKDGSNYSVNTGRENYPIRYVSALDAEAFAAWCSQTYGGNYRLPTEQEWEKAAGWDPVLQKLFSYGCHQDTISCAWCNYNSCKGVPTQVGFYNGINVGTNDAKNYYGCYDMSGNVWEWTSSIYSGSSRVIRGGTWSSTANPWTTTFRYGYQPSLRIGDVGFRLVLDLE